MNILHLLNVADWTFIAAGLAVTAFIMIAGGYSEHPRSRQPKRPRRRWGKS